VLTSEFLNCGHDNWIKLPRSSHHATKELPWETTRRDTRERVSGFHMDRWEGLRMCEDVHGQTPGSGQARI